MNILIPRSLKEHAHLFAIAAASFLLVYCSSFVKGYGYFIDEFYYIACAAHPAFGYVDHPPLAPLMLTVFRFVFGDSIASIRFLPALSFSVSVFLTGIVARLMGGGKIAQVIAACSMATAPMVVAFGGFYSMNAFEPVLALTLLFFTMRMVKENNVRLWIPIGITMGLGMMNKHTFGLFIICLILALLLTGKWSMVFNRWFLVGGVCGFAIFLPNIIWQIANGFPSLEFYRNISSGKNVYTRPVDFLLGQVMGMSPINVPIWLGGMVLLLASKKTREFRFLAFLFLGLFLALMMSGTSRSDRLIFAYPPVLAGGGLWLEMMFDRIRARWLAGVVVTILAAGLMLELPLILPYFSYETVRAHVERLHYNTELERGNKPPIPQLLADRIGWKEKYDIVLRCYRSLSEQDRKEAIIAAGNYGQAGALELFGRNDSLCPVVCTHNTYYLWSRDRLKNAGIVLRLSRAQEYDGLKQRFGSVEPCEGDFVNPYVTAHENNLKVFICKDPRIPLREMLDRGRTYY